MCGSKRYHHCRCTGTKFDGTSLDVDADVAANALAV
jgi:hypothetical protein